jgi:pyridoxamine 5'-phosphate oxidase
MSNGPLIGPAVSGVGAGLRKASMHPDPLVQFADWFAAVLHGGLPEPNAMTLATTSREGIPSARVVLLKEFDARGFVFFTNYDSPKGQDLAGNPNVALVFFWAQLQRQVRILGVAEKVSREESEQYFRTRPIGSQIGAWASNQSQVLRSRDELDRRVEELTEQYQDEPVPLPPYWGGYRVSPSAIEFWQARVNRLHDRFLYRRGSGAPWQMERLSP